MSNAVFERNEKRYIVSQDVKEKLLKELDSHTKPDEYSKYTICSLYFDTQDFMLAHKSVEKPIYKEKLRLKSYGVPDEDSIAFLEMKKKYKGVVSKRRIEQPLANLEYYLKTGVAPWDNSQLCSEIDYFIRFYQVEPKVFMAYDREAYVGREDPELRVTFDDSVRFRFTALDLKQGDYGTRLMNDDSGILEIRTLGDMPFWLSSALTRYHVFPSSFSKYGSVYQTYLEGNEKYSNRSYQAAF